MNNLLFSILIIYFNSVNFAVDIYLLKNYFHTFQLKNYSFVRYLTSMKKFLIAQIMLIVLLISVIFVHNFACLLIVDFLALTTNMILNSSHKQNKTPLVFTPKIITLYLISAIILLPFIFLKTCIVLSNFLLIFMPIISQAIDIFDFLKNKIFILKARKKLKAINPKIIAITGSNGKTSVKNILGIILSEKYNIQSTPSSFNTPLGISKFINNELRKTTQFLILEYGARKVGDIKKLCKLFGADLGIVTSVANQHLQTFKNIENIYKTKKELPDFLKEKLCVYNLDNEYVNKMFCEKFGAKIGISFQNNSSNIYATNYYVKDFKTYFTINIFNNHFDVSTSLLGKQNINNILLCVALAKELDISKEELINGIKKLQPIPHRLQYIKSHFNIIDDSYNCSILSAEYALDLMKNLNGKKMIVTPGIVEAGKDQEKINFKLGENLSLFDYVLIVGKTNKDAINNGILSIKKSAVLLADNVFFIENLDEAKKFYHLLSENDSILFLNDLPDDYD